MTTEQIPPLTALRFRARRQAIGQPAREDDEVLHALVALHGTDPATVHLSVACRRPPRSLLAWEQTVSGRFSDARWVRIMAMRRTVHVLTPELVPAAWAIALARVFPQQNKQFRSLLQESSLEQSAEWVEDAVLEALGDGDLSSEALVERVPALGTRVELSPGKPYAGTAPLVRYALETLSTAARVVRARPLGGWRAGGSSWARSDRWLQGLEPLPYDRAVADLLLAWVRAFGPATLADAAWWLGVPKGDVAKARKALGDQLSAVRVSGWPDERFVLTEDLPALHQPQDPVGPALLPALDPSVMAFQTRSPFLDPAWTELVDRSGNLAPTVWLDGKVVGGWACRTSGEVAVRLLTDVGQEASSAIEALAAQLTESLAGEVVRPRFPTPLVKELYEGT